MTHSSTKTPVRTDAVKSTKDVAVRALDRDAILKRGRTVMASEAAAITDAASRLDDAFVDAARALITCTGRVCVTGVGKAGLIGAKLQATLASTGTLAYSLHPVEALHGDLGMVHTDDIILALSKSGGSELVELLPRLKQLGCRVVILTARPDSPAARLADYVLHIGETAEACPLGLAPSSSTAAMLAVGDALALTVMECREVQADQYAGYHPGGALGRFLMKARDVMRTGADCPTCRESDTLAVCYETILGAPRRAGAAAIVNEKGRLAGIITHGDFFRMFLASDRQAQKPVSEVMTPDPKRVALDDRVTEALRIMRTHAIDELPVVDEQGTLAGMIDIQDLIARGFSSLDGS